MVLQRIEGIEKVEISYHGQSGRVTYDPALTRPDRFLPELEKMTGYHARLASPGDPVFHPAGPDSMAGGPEGKTDAHDRGQDHGDHAAGGHS